MNTNSNRYKLQQVVELSIGCNDRSKLSDYKGSFDAFEVTAENQGEINDAIAVDACDTLYKACLTYGEALLSISKGHQSWAVIKLYYAVFYLLRCLFATQGYGVVKCKGIYTLHNSIGSSPVKRDGGKHRGEDVRGDHKTAIYIYHQIFGSHDYLLSNAVEEKTVFEWMMSARESINYQHASFYEPEFNFFARDSNNSEGLAKWTKTYLRDDTGSYLFQPEHCGLAVPLYLLGRVREEFSRRLHIEDPISAERRQTLISLITPAGLAQHSGFMNIFI